jgi:hypothetical protein
MIVVLMAAHCHQYWQAANIMVAKRIAKEWDD